MTELVPTPAGALLVSAPAPAVHDPFWIHHAWIPLLVFVPLFGLIELSLIHI